MLRPGAATALLLAALSCAASPTDAAMPVLTGRLVLNEILYNPPGIHEAGAEAVEIHNPVPVPQRLDGWTLSDDDDCRDPRGHYGRWAHALDGRVVPPLGTIAVVIPSLGSTPRCLSLANAGDVVFLKDGTGAVVDAVCWGTGCALHREAAAAPAKAEDGHSVQRCFMTTAVRFYAALPTLGDGNAWCPTEQGGLGFSVYAPR